MQSATIRRSSSAIWDSVDGITVVCNLVSGELFEFNDTAATVWQICDGRDVGYVTDMLCAEYPEIDVQQVAADCAELLGLLEDEGLIVVGEPSRP